jgi:hypothetical protein
MNSHTLKWFNHEYPIIASLKDFPGWYLIAHPNGPALCDGDTISVIDIHPSDLEHQILIKTVAQRAYREFTWPKIKPDFFPNDQVEARRK